LNVVSFFEILVSLVGDDGKLTPIGMPRDSSLEGFFHGRVFYSLRSDLKRGDRTFKKGSVVAFPLASVKRGEAVQDELEIVFEPSATRFFKRHWLTKDSVLVEVLDNVMGKVLHLSPGGEGRWLEREIQLVGRGRARVYDVDPFSSHFLASFESFDTPLSLFTVRTLNAGGTPEKLKSAPARFDASNIVWTQRFTTSRDGTKVPYFILHRKDLALNGKNPTLLYGYGGFENAMMPSYMGVVGKVWLEKGGVFALANIRGGDEYGPGWHQAALRENRQNAFDDFVAIAEDLVNSKITSPSHLGIQGGSNGGLLTSVAFTQRPDLFGAVVSSVPLTDMLRYHKLLAGASWMHEYGNPEDTKMRDAILRYSPLHNLRREKRYPEVFFITSTKDDRVHPAHARKMVARLRELGHPVLYYENIEGGHGAAANLEQRIFLMALEYTYLWKKLGR
jgi:prolyl oligopeptidase